MKKFENIYNFSLRYAPPEIDLRKANILDDYGDESYSKLPIDHKKPEDVTRKEFDYYPHVYPFMEYRDLFFYLYGILVEYEKEKEEFEPIDSFMYSLDRRLETIQAELDDENLKLLREGLLKIWEVGEDDFADWDHCSKLQEFVGLKP